ncbi:hypothetical protein ACH5RR_013139 [Cinchona calisaya]|uniref:Uncharacterized protein n=1 Tax=Cinchona calisaya TaxID=153742 RepID=A0ABD3A1U4_9GENT
MDNYQITAAQENGVDVSTVEEVAVDVAVTPDCAFVLLLHKSNIYAAAAYEKEEYMAAAQKGDGKSTTIDRVITSVTKIVGFGTAQGPSIIVATHKGKECAATAQTVSNVAITHEWAARTAQVGEFVAAKFGYETGIMAARDLAALRVENQDLAATSMEKNSAIAARIKGFDMAAE